MCCATLWACPPNENKPSACHCGKKGWLQERKGTQEALRATTGVSSTIPHTGPLELCLSAAQLSFTYRVHSLRGATLLHGYSANPSLVSIMLVWNWTWAESMTAEMVGWRKRTAAWTDRHCRSMQANACKQHMQITDLIPSEPDFSAFCAQPEIWECKLSERS